MTFSFPIAMKRNSNLDFIVISLSAERLSGWARHIKMIEEICKDVSGSVLILTPEYLSQYTLLKKVGSRIQPNAVHRIH